MKLATQDAPAMEGLRRRGQFLISGLLWAAVSGLVVVSFGYTLVLMHLLASAVERLRPAIGLAAPAHGPDLLWLGAFAVLPLSAVVLAGFLLAWYRRLWLRRLRVVWPNGRDRSKYSRWTGLAHRASETERQQRTRYLLALTNSDAWPGTQEKVSEQAAYETHAEWLLAELEKDVAERALTTGLTVGISQNKYVDLFTIFAAALELQLHVLTRLGKRPSWAAWRLLIQRCGASLFLNSYLNRQDALALNLMIKKAGMGLQAAGDLAANVAEHLSTSDFDWEEALNLQHAGLLGIATKGLELGATMAMSVGQVGLHVLGTLIESAGDELAQGALAAGIIYFHGMALAADTLALDQAHRASAPMNRAFRDGVWKMGEVAGSILRDVIRQRRSAFRDRRQKIVTSLPKNAYAKIQRLFGRRSEAAQTEP